MVYATYDDIEGYMNDTMKIIGGNPCYGVIGITQAKQFLIISQEGILIEAYNYKTGDRYKVWTVKNDVLGAKIYDDLLANFDPGLEASNLTRRNNLVDGEVYIYTI